MIKVAFIIPSLDVGGSEQKVIDLASGLNKELFTPMIITITKMGTLLPKAESLGIKVLCTHKKGKFDLDVKNRIANLLIEEQIDIAHVFTSTGKLWGRLAAIKSHTKVIISTEESLFRNRFIDRFLERRLAKKTDAIITNSVATKLSVVSATRLPHSKYIVIHNGIHLEPFLQATPSKVIRTSSTEFIIVSVARFDPRKRLDLLIDAFSRLKAEAKLVLIGGGALEEQLKHHVDRLGISSKVLFLGFRTDIANLLREADLFVLPSDEEGFGNVIIEAMASGLPVVASRVGGIPEIIKPEYNGLLFDKGDVDQLTTQIQRLIDDPKFKQVLIQNALNSVSTFSLKHMVDDHQHTYLNLFHNKVKK